MEKHEASSEIPSMRWEPYMKTDVRNTEVLEKLPKRGYFLDNLEDFDAAFFGISPKEAEQLDPQQRIVLEVAWEALERAGVPPQCLSGSDTGVFLGVNSNDYSHLVLEDLPRLEPWMGIGTAYCGVPNRVSYQLDLMGPSMAVDAACASSLVAVHLGRQAILQGECKVAIVGGVNAMCHPGMTVVLDRAGATSEEGICQSFDDAAHGYGRGEGAAIIILKSIEDAINDKDDILALVKGSAVAQDGRTQGIMAPNSAAQELVARKALGTAGVDPATVNYVEAHATSTPVGDSTEITALSRVYGHMRKSDNPCYIGSVKPNIGHLEAGAGAVGFIKSVMSIHTGILAPQANLDQLNSSIDWAGAGLQVVQDSQQWPSSDAPRRAGVSSYGYGGTVSHVILEQYTPPPFEDKQSQSDGPQILLLSAPHENRISAQANVLSFWMNDAGKNNALSRIATTLATRRGHHTHRAALVVDNHHDAIEKLRSLSEDVSTEWVTKNRVLTKDTRKDVTFVFSGHGAQWADMGKQLLHNRMFYDTVASLDPIVKAEMEFSALDSFESGDFMASDRIQVLTYLFQVGLVAVLDSLGLQPNAIIGHSVGEIAAAVTAGCLTPKEGALIVTKRAKLYQSMIGLGAMAVVYRPFEEMKQELDVRTDIVAAINSSPSSCVLSGDLQPLETFCKSLNDRGIKTMRVRTDIAFHHPNLTALVEPLIIALGGLLDPRPPKVTLYSTCLDDPHNLQPREIDYWCKNMICPVQLSSAVASAANDGLRVFLEISSHPVISHSIQEILVDSGIDDFGVYHTMRRQQPAEKTILCSLAQLHCRGCDVNWDKSMEGSWISEVPVAGWSHQKFWRDIESGPLGAETTHNVEQHSLLGGRLAVAGEDLVTYTTILDEISKPFPGSHPVHGSEIIPAAVLINTFLLGTRAQQLSKLHLRVPITTNKARDIQFVVSSNRAKISSRLIRGGTEDHHEGGSWQTHTTGSWSTTNIDEVTLPYNVDIELKKSLIGERLEKSFSIDYLSKVGVSSMGFPWAILEHYGNQQEMIALVDVAPDIDSGVNLPWDPRSWAPVLDSATSVASTLFFGDPRLRMPSYVDKISVLTKNDPPKVCYLYIEATKCALSAAHITICDEEGKTLALIESMQFSEIDGEFRPNAGVEGLVHEVAWPPAVYKEKALPISHLVLISKHRSLAHYYGERVSMPVRKTTILTSVRELSDQKLSLGGDAAIVYLPISDVPLDSTFTAAHDHAMDLLDIVKLIVNSSLSIKVFVLTKGVSAGQLTALAQSPLHGLSRIIASEHSDIWGALIDLEEPTIPLEVMKYVQGEDVICISDGIPRIARLRPLPHNRLLPSCTVPRICRPEGTYLITGGLGTLGMETAEFLVEQGVRRVVLLSRRAVPPRKDWPAIIAESAPMVSTVKGIHRLEAYGATIKTIDIDIGDESSAEQLSMALDAFNLPAVSGVIHAAGVIENELVLSTTEQGVSHVLAPKISGAMLLHRLFPPGTLDFMIFFSSCGQLFGFPGQASYASGNAFLDTLAAHRRSQGDNAVSLQWSSWRGMGMATSNEFINAELANKGITDITRYEAFQALLHVLKYDISQAAVLRSLPIEEDEPIPSSILTDIIKRKPPTSSPSDKPPSETKEGNEIPSSIEERRAYLDHKIRDSVSQVLHLAGPEDVDPKDVMSDLGLDSVLTVSLRSMLQKALGVKVPPTLTWTCPTVVDLICWFESNI